MFEKASRSKLRYDVGAGWINTEDLWDLPLVNNRTKSTLSLDVVAKLLNKQLKESEEESFVEKRSTANTMLELKFDIVKHIIKVKLAEIEQKENKAVLDSQKDEIDIAIEQKRKKLLTEKSMDELTEMRKGL